MNTGTANAIAVWTPIGIEERKALVRPFLDSSQMKVWEEIGEFKSKFTELTQKHKKIVIRAVESLE